MDIHRKYYQLIPEKINEQFSTIVHLVKPEIKNFCSDYLREVISVVAIHVRRNDEDPPLRMAYLRRLVPHAEKYLNALTETGIIKRSPFYVPHQVSYRYSFMPEYCSKYIFLPLENKKVIRRIKNAYQETQAEAVKNIRGCSFQIKYIKQLSLADGWQDLIKSYSGNIDQYNSILASATRIINEDFFYSRDTTEKRFHSNVTTMKRELRKYLRIDGEPLANVDVKNCQPYLSTIILTYPQKVAKMTNNISFQMLLQSLKTSVYKDDVKKYISLVKRGNFYEYLMTKFEKGGVSLTREETKKQMLRILFAPNRMPKNEINRRCRQIFKNSFPTVYKVFARVRGRDQGTKFDNSNRFPILLASIESYLMLDVILRRIYKELPGVCAITIHDSIMTGILTDNIEAVRKIMIDEFEKFVGFAPHIAIEGYKELIKEENNMLIQYDVTTSVSLS